MSAQIEGQSDVLYKRWARTDWRTVRWTMHQVGQHRQEDGQMSSIPGRTAQTGGELDILNTRYRSAFSDRKRVGWNCLYRKYIYEDNVIT
jgi:hypothetical protein